MARVFIEGFETGDAGLWDECSTPAAIGSATGTSRKMTGNFCFDGNTSNTAIQFIKYLPASAVYYTAFSVNPQSISSEALCALLAGAIPVVSLSRATNSAGALSLRFGDDNTGVVLATSTATRGAAIGVRSNIVLKVDLSVAGMLTVLVTINGKTAIDITGLLTADAGATVTFTPAGGSLITLPASAVTASILAGTATINRLLIGSSSNTNLSYCYIDDIVVDNADAPIKPRVLGLKPMAVGDSTQFTSSDANPNWSNVGETPNNDETYVMSNTPGHQDLYAVTDLPPLYTDIRCIQISTRAWYEGNAAVRRLNLLVKPTAQATIESAPITLTQYPEGYSVLMTTNSNTTNPFTFDEIQGMQIGVEAVAPA